MRGTGESRISSALDHPLQRRSGRGAKGGSLVANPTTDISKVSGSDEKSDTEPLSTGGGWTADGLNLSSGLAIEVELARASVPRHGSARNLLPERQEPLLMSALPAGMTTSWEQHAESSSKRRRRRQNGESLYRRQCLSRGQPSTTKRYAHGGRSTSSSFSTPTSTTPMCTAQAWLNAAGTAMEALLSG